MVEKVTPIPRYRPYSGPVIFRQGFRPFFLGAGLWASLALALWMAAFHGWITLPTAFDGLAWHVHEMLFGFAVATIAGFMLTAIPNWTGRMPLQGRPLVGLFALWLLGRLAVGCSAVIGAAVAGAVDLSFLVVLAGVVVREIAAGRNWRNLVMPFALSLLIAANALTHLEASGIARTAEYGQRLGIAVVVMLIGLVGGRIVPSFTRNWLAKQAEGPLPAGVGRFDGVAIAIAALAFALWVLAPQTMVAGLALLAGAAIMAVRLARWRGHRTTAEPLVLSLHVGFAWLPIGLALTGLAALAPGVPATAGIHALTAGAIGAMTLAVMTRASLGHTGRTLAADRMTTIVYGLVAVAAALRVLAPFWAAAYGELLALSALAWIGAFGLFTIGYGRMLLFR